MSLNSDSDFAQVVETSVKVTINSPSQDYTHPDDHTSPTYHCYITYTLCKHVLRRRKSRLAH